MKVLIIGLGSIAKKHIKVLNEISSDIEIFAFRSVENSNQILGVTNIYSLANLAPSSYDFIIVSNPTSKHYETIRMLADSGIPLFIEKPVFNKVGKREEDLVQSFLNKKTSTYIACNLRFLDCLREIKKVIDGKRVNEVNVYCGSYLPNWRPNSDFRKVYSSHKDMGGGVHIDLIHELDYLYWIFGEPNTSSIKLQSKSTLNIDAYDYANYNWNYDGFVANIILNYYRVDAKRTFELVCENGTYLVDLLKNVIFYKDEIIYSSNQIIEDTYKQQMLFFIKDILRNKVNFNSIDEAYKLLQLCLKN